MIQPTEAAQTSYKGGSRWEYDVLHQNRGWRNHATFGTWDLPPTFNMGDIFWRKISCFDVKYYSFYKTLLSSMICKLWFFGWLICIHFRKKGGIFLEKAFFKAFFEAFLKTFIKTLFFSNVYLLIKIVLKTLKED